MDTAQAAAAVIIARARDEHGGDTFDYKISIEGVLPFGELYNEAYTLANKDQPPVMAGDGENVLTARKERAARLWTAVLPALEEYAAGCRAAKYTGWSRESLRPIRRVDSKEIQALREIDRHLKEGDWGNAERVLYQYGSDRAREGN